MKNKQHKVIIALTITVFGLELFQIFILHWLSTQGQGLAYLQSRIAAVQKDNMVLEEQVLRLESFRYIEIKARSEGFIPASDKNYMYLH